MSDTNQLIITLTAEGNETVNGPIGQKLLCYGLLECAKDAIREYNVANRSRIVVPDLKLVKHDA